MAVISPWSQILPGEFSICLHRRLRRNECAPEIRFASKKNHFNWKAVNENSSVITAFLSCFYFIFLYFFFSSLPTGLLGTSQLHFSFVAASISRRRDGQRNIWVWQGWFGVRNEPDVSAEGSDRTPCSSVLKKNPNKQQNPG